MVQLAKWSICKGLMPLHLNDWLQFHLHHVCYVPWKIDLVFTTCSLFRFVELMTNWLAWKKVNELRFSSQLTIYWTWNLVFDGQCEINDAWLYPLVGLLLKIVDIWSEKWTTVRRLFAEKIGQILGRFERTRRTHDQKRNNRSFNQCQVGAICGLLVQAARPDWANNCVSCQISISSKCGQKPKNWV